VVSARQRDGTADDHRHQGKLAGPRFVGIADVRAETAGVAVMSAAAPLHLIDRSAFLAARLQLQPEIGPGTVDRVIRESLTTRQYQLASSVSQARMAGSPRSRRMRFTAAACGHLSFRYNSSTPVSKS
jgi:hypothetical protein